MAPHVRERPGRRWPALAVLLASLGLGCQQGPAMVPVKGTVTFQGQPVGEGLVQFNDHKTGNGAEVPLQPDGTYEATLPPGDYAVVVLPPLLLSDGKLGPVDVKFKKVRNIPAKYQSTATSGLTAPVRADRAVHDFELRP